jgi:hypothetical protein
MMDISPFTQIPELPGDRIVAYASFEPGPEDRPADSI